MFITERKHYKVPLDKNQYLQRSFDGLSDKIAHSTRLLQQSGNGLVSGLQQCINEKVSDRYENDRILKALQTSINEVWPFSFLHVHSLYIKLLLSQGVWESQLC